MGFGMVIENFVHDTGYAFRILRRNPGFTATAVVRACFRNRSKHRDIHGGEFRAATTTCRPALWGETLGSDFDRVGGCVADRHRAARDVYSSAQGFARRSDGLTALRIKTPLERTCVRGRNAEIGTKKGALF
jgi:hypothetical protein